MGKLWYSLIGSLVQSCIGRSKTGVTFHLIPCQYIFIAWFQELDWSIASFLPRYWQESVVYIYWSGLVSGTVYQHLNWMIPVCDVNYVSWLLNIYGSSICLKQNPIEALPNYDNDVEDDAELPHGLSLMLYMSIVVWEPMKQASQPRLKNTVPVTLCTGLSCIGISPSVFLHVVTMENVPHSDIFGSMMKL